MNASFFAGFAIVCATTALAAQTPQTPGAPPSSQAAAGLQNQSVTLIGCVAAGAAASDPFTLSDVTHGSVGTTTPGQMTSGTLPPTTSVVSATPPAGSVPPPTPTGVAGTAGTAVPPATAGTAGAAAPTTGAVGTAGTVAGGAGSAASTAATPAGYVLNGYDVSAYRGQRVQVVGVFAPATSPGATPAAGTNPPAAPGAPTPREFRVQSVTPVSGNCPQR